MPIAALLLIFFAILSELSCVTENVRPAVQVSGSKIYTPLRYNGRYDDGRRSLVFQGPPRPAFLASSGQSADFDEYDIVNMKENSDGSITFTFQSTGSGPLMERTFLFKHNLIEEKENGQTVLWRRSADE